MSRARLPVLLLVIGALVAAVLLDRSSAPDGPTVAAPEGLFARDEPVVASDDVLGSTWFCPAGSAGDIGDIPDPVEVDAAPGAPAEPAEGDDQADAEGDGEEDATETIVVGPIVAEHTVVIANVTDRDVEAGVTIHPGSGDPVRLTIELAASTVERVELADHVEGPAVAAMVEAPGGGVAVSHVLEGEHGTDAGPCASTSSDEWHFAWGDTSRDARSFVALFNPFPRDAVVDMTFATVDGTREPRALTGLVVPGEGVVVADVGAEVRRRDQVAMTVRSRAGRVVAERLQSFDGSGDGVDAEEDGVERRGLAADLGVPRPQEVWAHAYGRWGPDVAQRLVIYNPTETPAEVDVEVGLGAEVVGGVAPFELNVRPRSFTTIDLDAEPRLLDVLGTDDAEMSLTVRSLNGVPVVSDLVTRVDGTAASVGRATAATEHVLVDPLGGDATGRLRVLNPASEQPATVELSVVRNGRRSEIGTTEIDPAGREVVEIDEDDLGSGPAALVISSSSPVVVELVSRFDDPSDLGVRSAVPVAGTISVLDVLGG